MELSRSDRLRIAVKWLSEQSGITTAEMGRRLGYSNASYFSQLINGKKPVAEEVYQKLAAMDPRINMDFLTGLSDDMLLPGNEQPGMKPTPAQQPRQVGIFVPPELAQMVTDLTTTIRDQQAMIRTMVDTWVRREAK